jgi:hypothetical protein
MIDHLTLRLFFAARSAAIFRSICFFGTANMRRVKFSSLRKASSAFSTSKCAAGRSGVLLISLSYHTAVIFKDRMKDWTKAKPGFYALRGNVIDLCGRRTFWDKVKHLKRRIALKLNGYCSIFD